MFVSNARLVRYDHDHFAENTVETTTHNTEAVANGIIYYPKCGAHDHCALPREATVRPPTIPILLFNLPSYEIQRMLRISYFNVIKIDTLTYYVECSFYHSHPILSYLLRLKVPPPIPLDENELYRPLSLELCTLCPNNCWFHASGIGQEA